MKKRGTSFLASALIFWNTLNLVPAEPSPSEKPSRPYKVELKIRNGEERYLEIYDISSKNEQLETWSRSSFKPDGLADAIADHRNSDHFLYVDENQIKNMPLGKVWRNHTSVYTRIMSPKIRKAASEVLKYGLNPFSLKNTCSKNPSKAFSEDYFRHMPSSIDLRFVYPDRTIPSVELRILDLNKDGIPDQVINISPQNGQEYTNPETAKKILESCTKLYSRYRED
ncbi:hypothetical protein COU54_05760 [Candidatus Pacearchaeota archaeon CG10_big_fil_rev_8_21_14_0_10_31_24]|nr:MAG: hypothetical protein COU54_05760 [Candidatus Pacearchaeota archaeon CG10_big_fil_rev_8_21_14_0_10_31_24]